MSLPPPRDPVAAVTHPDPEEDAAEGARALGRTTARSQRRMSRVEVRRTQVQPVSLQTR
jgi:hypothetical protein